MGEPRWVAVGRLCRVRAFTRADVDRWLGWPLHSDPLYSGFDPTPMDGSVRDAWYAVLTQRQGQLPFAIEALDRQMIGRLFLRHVRPTEASSVLGIDLDPRFVGRGHGTDALAAFMGYYFGRAGFRRLLLTVAAYNARARRSYERCGFRYIGTHWEGLKLPVDVPRDPRCAELRSCFRNGPRGLEAMMHDMVAEQAPTPTQVARPGAAGCRSH